jgi:acyl dehydratase
MTETPDFEDPRENTLHEIEPPGMLANYARAVMGMLPTVKRGKETPTRTLVVRDVKIDQDNVVEYCDVTGLRLRDTLPVTYPFVLSFPTVMSLLVAKDFPLPAMGMVHLTNTIEQLRPITVREVLDISVHAENLREHRSGMLIDLITEVTSKGESGDSAAEQVWKQTSTFLAKQKTSLSGQPRATDEADKPTVPALPTTRLKVTATLIGQYADCSGDRNPIHTSKFGARAFGFPSTIAHGMWSAAAILQTLEGRIPAAATYSVEFGKPVLLPAKVAVFTAKDADGNWNLALRSARKETVYLNASVKAR